MNFRNVLSVLGGFLTILGASMLLPLGCSILYGEQDSQAILLSLAITCGSGALLFFFFRLKEKRSALTHREGFLIVSLGWISASIFGSLPYMLQGILPSFADAFFETMSGFTTTGATVIRNIDPLPHGILLWRALTQWLGGMGIIILAVAILPFLGVGGRQLFKAEVPGPVKDKLTPRIIETARALWITYIILSIAEFVFLLLGGMSLFDSVCHTFATMATGGFSTKDSSIAHYNSAYIDAVVTIFMVLAGMNFTLHYCLLTGDIRSFYKDPELRFYLAVIFTATTIVTLDLRLHIFQSIGDAFRYGVFHVVSIITTTGFVTDNFAKWPALSQVILLLLMFVGGSQGSTGGSIKCIRILLILKQTYKELYRLVHPHAIVRIKLGGQMIPPDTMQGVWGFFALYLGIAILATIIMSSLGLDMMTSFSSVAATLGNVGPGMGIVHPATTYADIPITGKWILSFCMLVGRLEIYTVIILLIPEFWKK